MTDQEKKKQKLAADKLAAKTIADNAAQAATAAVTVAEEVIVDNVRVPEGTLVEGLDSGVLTQLRESYSSLIASGDTSIHKRGDLVAFGDDKPFAIEFGPYGLAFNDFGRVKTMEGMSLSKFVKANSDGDKIYMPETLQVISVTPTKKYKLTAYTGYDAKKFAGTPSDELIKTLAAEIRATDIRLDARPDIDGNIPDQYVHMDVRAKW